MGASVGRDALEAVLGRLILEARKHFHNRDFEQASLVAPNHPEVILFDQMMFRKASRLYQAAVAHMEAERFPQAADELTRALRVTPDDAKLLVLRATALRLTRRFKEALADLDTASKTYVSIFLDL